MTEAQYKAMKVEVFEIEELLMNPERRKDVALILRHDLLCKQIHGYELRRASAKREAA